jgi:hypothetical protein
MDLHVHNQRIEFPWYTDQDCFYGNCVLRTAPFVQKAGEKVRTNTLDLPIWDPDSPPGEGGNPRQDTDNTYGYGPENTNINRPSTGVQYTVGVHNYAAGAGRIATIKIYCGDLTDPAATFVSRAFTGNSGGNCSVNDFWKVAGVNFSSPTECSIVPIDTYSPSSERCAQF